MVTTTSSALGSARGTGSTTSGSPRRCSRAALGPADPLDIGDHLLLTRDQARQDMPSPASVRHLPTGPEIPGQLCISRPALLHTESPRNGGPSEMMLRGGRIGDSVGRLVKRRADWVGTRQMRSEVTAFLRR